MGACIDDYSNNGVGWSQGQASLHQQQSPHPRFLPASSVRKVYGVGSFLVFLFDQGYSSSQKDLLAIYDVNTQQWLTQLTGLDEDLLIEGLHVEDIKRIGEGIILMNKSRVLRLDVNMTIQQEICAKESEWIKAADACNQYVAFSTVVVKKVKKKKKGKEVDVLVPTANQHLYRISRSGKGLTCLHSFQSDAAISGVDSSDQYVLYWFVREKKPLELWAFSTSASTLIPVPGHSLLEKAPRDILHFSTGNGFTFRSGESSLRWVVRYDYPMNDDEGVQHKEMILENHLAWQYAQDNCEQLIDLKRDIKSTKVLSNVPVFAEVMPYGVVVHYKPSSGLRGRTLLWSGQTIRGYVLCALLPKGLVILKRNRDIIVLQLMKGKDDVPFATLFTH